MSSVLVVLVTLMVVCYATTFSRLHFVDRVPAGKGYNFLFRGKS